MGVFDKLKRKNTSATERSASQISAAPSTHLADPEKKAQDPSVTLARLPTEAHSHDNQSLEKSSIDEPKDDDEEDNTDYPKSWKLGLITTALCLSVFCMALDNTIIATAIPRITDRQ